MALKLAQFRYYGENNPIQNNFPLLYIDRLDKIKTMITYLKNHADMDDNNWNDFWDLSKGVIDWGAPDDESYILNDFSQIKNLVKDKEIQKYLTQNYIVIHYGPSVENANGALDTINNDKEIFINDLDIDDFLKQFNFKTNEKQEIFLKIKEGYFTFSNFKELNKYKQILFLYEKFILFDSIVAMEKEKGRTVLWPQPYTFQKYEGLQKISIHTLPGIRIYMNRTLWNGGSPFIVGKTGILEGAARLQYTSDEIDSEQFNNTFLITGFELDENSKKTINSVENGHLIITLTYSEKEKEEEI